MNTLSLSRILLDGLLYSVILTVLIIASLVWNPRLWIHDAPKPMREKVAPLTSTEKRQRIWLAAVFILTTLGIPVWLALRLDAQFGGLAFGTLFLYVFGVLMVFNLFDTVVIDVLIVSVWYPPFLRVAGTEGMEHFLRDPKFHLTAYFKGLIFCTVGAFLLSGLAFLL